MKPYVRALSSLLLAATLVACGESTLPAIDTDMDGITDAEDPTPNGSTRNRLNGTFTGGFARAVEITWYDETGAEDVDMAYEYDLDVDCSDEWYPQGTMCDESPTTDDPNVSTKTNNDSGATWDTSVAGPNSGTGVLVVDACYTGGCTAIDVNEARVFQMYSDGKATHVRIFFHPELGDTPPVWNDDGWVAQGDFVTIDEGALAVPGEPLVVTSPTIIELTPTVTRYVRFDVQNDNRYAVTESCCSDPGYYIELRSVKLYSVALPR
jgi:hypothetical protein